MKKINWRLIGMLVLLVVATVIGVGLMEDYWIEESSAAIWCVGMICVTILFRDNEKQKRMPDKYVIVRSEKEE